MSLWMKIRGNSFLFASMLVWTLLRSVAVSEQGKAEEIVIPPKRDFRVEEETVLPLEGPLVDDPVARREWQILTEHIDSYIERRSDECHPDGVFYDTWQWEFDQYKRFFEAYRHSTSALTAKLRIAYLIEKAGNEISPEFAARCYERGIEIFQEIAQAYPDTWQGALAILRFPDPRLKPLHDYASQINRSIVDGTAADPVAQRKLLDELYRAITRMAQEKRFERKKLRERLHYETDPEFLQLYSSRFIPTVVSPLVIFYGGVARQHASAGNFEDAFAYATRGFQYAKNENDIKHLRDTIWEIEDSRRRKEGLLGPFDGTPVRDEEFVDKIIARYSGEDRKHESITDSHDIDKRGLQTTPVDAVPDLSASGQVPGMPLSTPGVGESPRRLAHEDTTEEGMGWTGRIAIGVLVLAFVILGSIFVFRRVFPRVR